MNVFGYDIQEGVVFLIRIIATIGAAVVGWFVCDPSTRAIYWLAKRAATPTLLLFCTKSLGALALASAVWFLMPEGGNGGGGGPGLGPGSGGLPSKGGDKASDKTGEPVKDVKIEPKKDKIDAKTPLEPVEIEIISDTMYQKLMNDDKKECWYVIKGKAYSYDELDNYLRANRSKIEVTPVLTKHSIRLGRTELTDLTKKYNIKTLQYKTTSP
jgi:hypothetical protein